MIQGYGFELEKIIKDVYPDTNFYEILEIYKNTIVTATIKKLKIFLFLNIIK